MYAEVEMKSETFLSTSGQISSVKADSHSATGTTPANAKADQYPCNPFLVTAETCHNTNKDILPKTYFFNQLHSQSLSYHVNLIMVTCVDV